MFAAIRNYFRKKPSATIQPATAEWIDDFYDEAIDMRRYTPDYPELERQEWHYFFSCDETQKGHHQEILLKDAVEKVEHEAFSQDRFMMLNNDLDIFSHPLIFMDDLGYQNPPKLLPIKGELYKVTPQQIAELDKYKQNTVFCFRRQVSIAIPYMEIFAKDRAVLEKMFKGRPRVVKLPDKGGKEVIRNGRVIQSNLMTRPGIRRVWAWIYISDKYYWEDLINRSDKNRPVYSYTNDHPQAVVKEYYRFTDAEYKPKPPWE